MMLAGIYYYCATNTHTLSTLLTALQICSLNTSPRSKGRGKGKKREGKVKVKNTLL